MAAPQSPNSSSSGPASQVGSQSARPDLYDERLTVPWWWWVAGAVVTGVVGYEIQLSAHKSAWSVAGYVVVGILAAALLWSMGRTRVAVTADGELVADKARLPREVVARGATVAATAKSAALGRQLDPAAFLMHRAWIKAMVLLVLDDPDDPTPYWLVSTRHPDRVLAALGIDDAAASPRDRAPRDRD
ncbi:hypothetical protein M2359_002433 [Gordonia amarae]|uniref:DUF3093 domain-containing protein n=1 Tax=Gordonia amarae TaxID=36821 RepID=UPI000681C492|nr:DUF3093 domain-containing protein [Gordonia amarae]MCS3878804.1 hypothetical protein [Gordonia amarae]